MAYAIVEFAGKQLMLEPNQEVRVDGQWGKVGETLTFDKVLALNSKSFELGAPYLKTNLSATVKEHAKGKKIDVRTYKSKSRYRRHIGYRSLQTVLTISAFHSSSTAVPAAKKASPEAKVASEKPANKTAKKAA